MLDTMTYTGTLTVITCWNCSSIYAIPERLYRDAKNEGKNWWCPCCGKSTIVTETEMDRMRKQLARAKDDVEFYRKDARREALEAQKARHRERAQKAAKTRLKNRIANGVCPCCRRHFKNVAAHMKTQHPEFRAPE